MNTYLYVLRLLFFPSNMRFFYSHITCKHLKMCVRDTWFRKCIFELTFTNSKSNYVPRENWFFSLFEFFFKTNSLLPKAILLEASMNQFYIYYILVVTTPFNFLSLPSFIFINRFFPFFIILESIIILIITRSKSILNKNYLNNFNRL